MWEFLKKYTYINEDNEEKSLYDNYSYLQRHFLQKDPSCYTSIGGILDQSSRILAKKFGMYDDGIFTTYYKDHNFRNKILDTGFLYEELRKLKSFYYESRGNTSHGKLSSFKEDEVIEILECLFNYLKYTFRYYFKDKDIPNKIDREYYYKLKEYTLNLKEKEKEKLRGELLREDDIKRIDDKIKEKLKEYDDIDLNVSKKYQEKKLILDKEFEKKKQEYREEEYLLKDKNKELEIDVKNTELERNFKLKELDKVNKELVEAKTNIINSRVNSLDLEFMILNENNDKGVIYNAIECKRYDYALIAINKKLSLNYKFNKNEIDGIEKFIELDFNKIYEILVMYDLNKFFDKNLIKKIIKYEIKNNKLYLFKKYYFDCVFNFKDSDDYDIFNSFIKLDLRGGIKFVLDNKNKFNKCKGIKKMFLSFFNNGSIISFINEFETRDYLSDTELWNIFNDYNIECNRMTINLLKQYDWGRKKICEIFILKYKNRNRTTTVIREYDNINISVSDFAACVKEDGLNEFILDIYDNVVKKIKEEDSKLLDLFDYLLKIDYDLYFDDDKKISDYFILWCINNKKISNRDIIERLYFNSITKLDSNMYYNLYNGYSDIMIDFSSYTIKVRNDLSILEYQFLVFLYKKGVNISFSTIKSICINYDGNNYRLEDIIDLLNENVCKIFKDKNNYSKEFFRKYLELSNDYKILYNILLLCFKDEMDIDLDTIKIINNKGIYLCDYKRYGITNEEINSLKWKYARNNKVLLMNNLNLNDKIKMFNNSCVYDVLNDDLLDSNFIDKIWFNSEVNNDIDKYNILITAIKNQDMNVIKNMKRLCLDIFKYDGKEGLAISVNKKFGNNSEINKLFSDIDYSKNDLIGMNDYSLINLYINDEYDLFRELLYNKNKIYFTKCNSNGLDIIDILMKESNDNKYYKCLKDFINSSYDYVMDSYGYLFNTEYRKLDKNKIDKMFFINKMFFVNVYNINYFNKLDNYQMKILKEEYSLEFNNIIIDVLKRDNLVIFKKILYILSNDEVNKIDYIKYRCNNIIRFLLDGLYLNDRFKYERYLNEDNIEYRNINNNLDIVRGSVKNKDLIKDNDVSSELNESNSLEDDVRFNMFEYIISGLVFSICYLIFTIIPLGFNEGLKYYLMGLLIHLCGIILVPFFKRGYRSIILSFIMSIFVVYLFYRIL